MRGEPSRRGSVWRYEDMYNQEREDLLAAIPDLYHGDAFSTASLHGTTKVLHARAIVWSRQGPPFCDNLGFLAISPMLPPPRRATLANGDTRVREVALRALG